MSKSQFTRIVLCIVLLGVIGMSCIACDPPKVSLCDGMGSADKIAACHNNEALAEQTANNVANGSKVVATMQAPKPVATAKP